jgi:hypothetical protein
MEESSLVDKVHGLSDLELETLLSLLANEHCIIWTQEDALDTLSEELELVSVGFFLSVFNPLTATDLQQCLWTSFCSFRLHRDDNPRRLQQWNFGSRRDSSYFGPQSDTLE